MKNFKRGLSLFLAIVLCLGLLSGAILYVSAVEDYSGTYYIAAKRSSGNYFYMTNDLGTGSTKRYTAVDSGLTTLPESIDAATSDATKTFTLIKNADGTYCIKDSDGKFLSWTSGNSGTLVAQSDAKAFTVEVKDGAINIHFAASDAERYLALNSNSGNNYFAWYKSGQRQALTLIPVKSADSGDSGDTEQCAHANITTTTVDATCTEPGSTTVTCNDCSETVSTETIPALGHAYVDLVCTRCGDKVEDRSGTYYVAVLRSGSYWYMTNVLGTADTKRYTAVNSGLTELPALIFSEDRTKEFTLQINDDGTYYMTDSTGLYLAWAGDNSGTLVEAANAAKLNLTAAADGTVQITLADTPSRYLSLNGGSGNYFAWYAGTQLQDLHLIPVDAGACPHENTVLQNKTDATCTEAGYSGDVFCTDCKTVIENGTEIEATGHDYVGTVTDPVGNTPGFTTYVCSTCADTKVEQLPIYTVSFAVPEGIAAIENAFYVPTTQAQGITLPELAASGDYTFLGWSETKVELTSEAPAYFEAGTVYVPTASVTLYPVYTYVGVGRGEITWEKTALSDISATDRVVITMTYTDGTVYAMTNDNGTGSAPAAPTVTVSEDKLVGDVAESIVWNIETDGSSYTIYPAGQTAKWLYCTNTNNGVRVGTNANKAFTLDSASGYFKNTATGRFLGVYRTNPDWRCYTDTTGNTANQTLGIFKECEGVGETSVLYSSLDAVAASGVCQITSFDGVRTYIWLSNAANACKAGEYVKLIAAVSEDVELTADLYLDLNKFDVTGKLTVAEGATLYGMDTTTDDYSCTSGYGKLTNVTGNVAAYHKDSVTGALKTYVTIDEDGVLSFHRIYVGLTHITLKPGTTGVGYKAMFCGDDKVKEQIESFGYTLTLGDYTPVTVTKTGAEFESNAAVTLRVDNYQVEEHGQTELSAQVSMKFKNGVEITGTAQSITMRSLMERINAIASTLEAEQLSAIATMIENNPIIKTWDTADLWD